MSESAQSLSENICGFAQSDRSGNIVFSSGNFPYVLGDSVNIRQVFALSETDYDTLLDQLDESGGRLVRVLPLNSTGPGVGQRNIEIHDGGQHLLWLVGQRAGTPHHTCELVQQHEKLRMILDHAPIGIWMQNGYGKLEFVNKAFCSATGVSEVQFLAVPHYKEVIPEEYRDICLQSDDKALASDQPTLTLQQLPFADGLVHDLHVIKAVQRNAKGEPLALVGLALDITDQRRQETALKEAQWQMRQLALQDEKNRLKERRQIAQYLHDDLGQSLTSLSMAFEHLAESMVYPEEIAEQFDGIFEKITDAINSTRHVTAMLRPPAALEHGLQFAVAKLLARLHQPGLPKITVDISDDQALRSPKNEDVILASYRVIQESLTNILRHARAKQVQVDVRLENGNLLASIRDDGCGFPLKSLKYCSGIGILGMRERAEMLRGRLDIDSSVGEGTRLTLSLPFETRVDEPTPC